MFVQQCLGLLASLLHCKPGTFATAGTKDKRAVTVQHVTAFKVLLISVGSVLALLEGYNDQNNNAHQPLPRQSLLCLGAA